MKIVSKVSSPIASRTRKQENIRLKITIARATKREKRVAIEEGKQQLITAPLKSKPKMEHVRRVKTMVMDGNLAENRRRFERNFQNFLIAAGLERKTDKVKIATFLNAIGEDALEVYDTFTLTPEQREQYDEVIKAFQEFCKPKTNEVYERFVFYKRNQSQGEPFDVFLMDIKRLVKSCNFADKEEEMLRDRIVLGVNENNIQIKLIETQQLTYAAAVEKCRAHEITKEQSAAMKNNTTVHEVKQNRQQENSNKDKSNKFNSDRNKTNNQNRDGATNGKCTRCQKNHKPRECPAYGKKCKNCGKVGHFAVGCRVKTVKEISQNKNDNQIEINN